MRISPTARTLAECRKRGWLVQVVERWVPMAKRRIDLFGCIDLVAIDEIGILGIQATSGGSGGGVGHRLEKIRTECQDAARRWLAAGARLEVWGWRKAGPRGQRKLWTVRIVPVTLEMLSESGNREAGISGPS